MHGEVLLLRRETRAEGGASVARIAEWRGEQAGRLALQQSRRESSSFVSGGELRLSTTLQPLRELLADHHATVALARSRSWVRGAHGWCVQMALAFLALAVLSAGVPILIAFTLHPVEDAGDAAANGSQVPMFVANFLLTEQRIFARS